MASNFPGGLDAYDNPTAASTQNVGAGGRTHSAMHADTFDAIEALQAKVGIDASAVATSLDNKHTTHVALVTAHGISVFGATLVDDADAAAARTTMGLTIGTNVQAYDAELAAVAGLASAADKGIQFTGAGTAATFDLTAAGKALIDDADAPAQRTTLGLGTVATQNANAVVITGGTINGTTIGATTPATGAFTTISATGAVTLTAASSGLTIAKTTGTTLTVSSTAASSIPSANAIYSIGGIGSDRSVNAHLVSADQTSSAVSGYFKNDHSATASGTYYSRGFTAECKPTVASTFTDSGHHTGIRAEVMRNYRAGDGSGTLAKLVGSHVAFGHFNSAAVSPVTTGVIGLELQPHAITGTITTLTGLVVKAAGTGGTVTTQYGILIEDQSLGATSFAIYTGAGRVRLGDTTASTSPTTGGVIALGGVGIAGALNVGAASTYTVTDAGTATAPNIETIRHNSSGTPAAGFGTTFAIQGQSNTTVNRDMASIAATWVVATDASRTARVVLSAFDTAAREVMRGEASGTVPLIGFLGATAVARTLLAAATGTATRTTFATSTVTLPQLAERVMAIIADLRAYGLEG